MVNLMALELPTLEKINNIAYLHSILGLVYIYANLYYWFSTLQIVYLYGKQLVDK